MDLRGKIVLAGYVSILGGIGHAFYQAKNYSEIQARPHMKDVNELRLFSRTIDGRLDRLNEKEVIGLNSKLYEIKKPLIEELKRLNGLEEVKRDDAKIEKIEENAKYTTYSLYTGFGLLIASAFFRRIEKLSEKEE